MNSLFLDMLQRFQQHLANNATFLKDKKLLLAISGGLDSMVMAELFRIAGYDISLAHCNFKLRGQESDSDAGFVAAYAKKHNLKLYLNSFDTKAFAADHKLSIQAAARQLRYLWFDEVLKQNGLDFILTAHHADDSIETFLINLSRGTGIEGLTGIPEQNGNIIRPMLSFSRNEIEDYAKENDIQWREDSSNASDKYLRNMIRHDIVPQLKSLNSNFVNSFLETIEHLQQTKSMAEDASNLVYKQVVIEKEDKVIFKIHELKMLPNYSAYLYNWLKDFGFKAWDDIYKLPDAQSGKQIFSSDYVLLKDREILILTKIHEEADLTFTIHENTESINEPLKVYFSKVGEINKEVNDCIFVDDDKLKYPLQIRKWKEGDVFYPFGMDGKKKLSKFFKDEKFSLIDKTNVWILCSENEIVWIINHRMDDRFKVTDTTKNILQIKTA